MNSLRGGTAPIERKGNNFVVKTIVENEDEKKEGEYTIPKKVAAKGWSQGGNQQLIVKVAVVTASRAGADEDAQAAKHIEQIKPRKSCARQSGDCLCFYFLGAGSMCQAHRAHGAHGPCHGRAMARHIGPAQPGQGMARPGASLIIGS